MQCCWRRCNTCRPRLVRNCARERGPITTNVRVARNWRCSSAYNTHRWLGPGSRSRGLSSGGDSCRPVGSLVRDDVDRIVAAIPDSNFKQPNSNTRPRSRGAMRPSFARQSPSNIRGRRECRVPAAPAASRAKLSEAHERSHHRSRRINRHSPRNGFTAYSVLSPATNSSCHRHPRIKALSAPGRAD
jgi:hypothetical protein